MVRIFWKGKITGNCGNGTAYMNIEIAKKS